MDMDMEMAQRKLWVLRSNDEALTSVALSAAFRLFSDLPHHGRP
jgi:hypothetical protein